MTDLAPEHYPILVTGAGGLLGRALGPRLARSAPCAGDLWLTDLKASPPAGRALDVTDAAAVEAAVRDLAPRTVFHLAAWTDVDGAESRPDEVMRLNVEAAEGVARAAADCGALVVHMSTDFIFDGTKHEPYVEEDPPSPLGVYARSKAGSETRVRAAAPGSHLIVRTAWLYGAGGPNFVETILASARAGERLRVVRDQVGCPTWSEDLALALVAMVGANLRGTYHACGRGVASRWQFAREIVRAAGLDVPVEPITSRERPGEARRPARAVLSTEKLRREAGHQFPDWRESVRAYVARLR
jgi:dTDP-4-dehydrorhamnose reductase